MRQKYPLEEVRSFVQRRYGLNIPQLPIRFESGLENTNYLITASKGEKYVFKVYEELQKPTIPTITFELSFLQYCKNAGLPVQTIVHSVQGNERVFFRKKPAVLLSYISGNNLREQSLNPTLAKKIGELIASFHLKAASFQVKGNPLRIHYWDLAQFLVNEQRLSAVPPKMQKKVQKGIAEYHQILPVLKQCKKGIIHNDFNQENVIVSGKNVMGIIDFGDAIKTILVADIAIAFAHLCFLQSKPLIFCKEMYQAYTKKKNLNRAEQGVLFSLVKARFITGIINGYFNERQLGRHQDFIWIRTWGVKGLSDLEEIGEKQFNTVLGIQHSNL